MIDTYTDPEVLAELQTRFDADTAGHEMTVLKDDGPYRHLRCRKPGTVVNGWDVVTWPGHLQVTGDRGSWTFARLPDMLLDFFNGCLNPDYWLEKCTAWDRDAKARGRFDAALVRKYLLDNDEIGPYLKLMSRVQEIQTMGLSRDALKMKARELLNEVYAADPEAIDGPLSLDGELEPRLTDDPWLHDLLAGTVTEGSVAHASGFEDHGYPEKIRNAWRLVKLSHDVEAGYVSAEQLMSEVMNTYDSGAWEWDTNTTDPAALYALMCVVWTRKAYLDGDRPHHRMTIEWDASGYETRRLECHAPLHAPCHVVFDCGCETYDGIHDVFGLPVHEVQVYGPDGTTSTDLHVGRREADGCALVGWFDEQDENIVAGRLEVPISGVWNGGGVDFTVGS